MTLIFCSTLNAKVSQLSLLNPTAQPFVLMGWRVEDAGLPYRAAAERGAKPADDANKDLPPAIYGIGDSLIYFIDTFGADNNIYADFEDLDEQVITQEKGFIEVDHLTNNVYKGTMERLG